MNLTDIITITITKNTRTVARAGFGLPLIVSHTAAWTERVRSYTSLSAVAIDFATTTPEYLAAAAIFEQDPHPPTVFIGRANQCVPIQQFELTPVVANNYVYSFLANGNLVTYTSGGSATATAITAGLKAAFDAFSLPYTSSQQISNTVLRLLANAGGDFLSIRSTDANLPVAQDHAVPTSPSTMAAELTAIRNENSQWYGLVTLFNSYAVVEAVAAYAAGAGVMYVAQTSDSVVRDSATVPGTNDIGGQTKTQAYTHASVHFSPETADFLDAAILGACLPLDPGSETWAYKSLVGVSPGVYTATQRTHFQAKNVNFYEATAGINITFQGQVADGEYIDTIRLIDFIEARVAEEIFSVLANARKIPFDDKGIAAVGGAIRRVLKQIANPPYVGIEPNFTVVLPAAADISPTDKAARTLNGVAASAQLTGAVHFANLEINVSV